jgi:cullin 3
MSRTNAETIWNSLATAIDEIVLRNSSILSFEELYRNSYNLVIQKHGKLLYDGVTAKLSSHLNDAANRLSSTPDSSLLEEIALSFENHVITMTMVRDILMYMDRTYVASNHEKSTFVQGLHLYRVLVWEHYNVQHRASELLMEVILKERKGEITDETVQGVLKKVLAMLLQMDAAENHHVYERDFGNMFLGSTQEFYQMESSAYLAVNSASDYVQKAKTRLEEERSRCVSLALPPNTVEELQKILYAELIQRHAKTLVSMENSGFSVLLKDETKVKAMGDMYDLFVKVPSSVEDLRVALCDRVKVDGMALVADQERGASDPSSFVKGVLKMNDMYHSIVDKAFRGEARAKKRLKKSFENFLNADTRAASCLAVYADDLLRSGIKGVSEAEIARLLNSVIVVFRYISDKDVFESFYKQHLAKRLLMGRSVSDEAEKQMVSLLKAECGYQFTSKLEGMFNDMRISRDTRDAYKSHKRELAMEQGGKKAKGAVDIDVDVLTTGYWPNTKVPICNLPSQVQTAIDHFSTFYLQKHTGRKLSWQTATGTAEVKATFGSVGAVRVYSLTVTTYQMCILALFNSETKLTLGKIASETNIPDLELRRHLISLTTPKHRILRKGSKGKGISGDDETFTFNPDYKSNSRRVKVPLVSIKEASKNKKGGVSGNAAAHAATSSSGEAMPPQLEEERRHLVEAATVRIMKARKQLHHNDLIAEVTRQLQVRFLPTPQFIKKRIEGLIEREYLERNEDDHRLYMYVA